MKQCGLCHQWKKEAEFHWYNKALQTWQPYCKDCMAESGYAQKVIYQV